MLGVGTQEACMAIRTDPQMENRYPAAVGARLEDGDVVDELTASLPLRSSSPDLVRSNLIGNIASRTEDDRRDACLAACGDDFCHLGYKFKPVRPRIVLSLNLHSEVPVSTQ
ncbi:hypothetical protein I3J13_25305 [Agrobacterium sp. MOPV5]|uniref:hypothetical protein n=1 Tax=Agrobacterium leguminum TaxID=2792015 RepID=UPI0018C31302|nr:hypothetical protein [Agrobacterium leguminum]